MAEADNPRLTPELETTLRRYVTGGLDEAVRTELEERLVTEPSVFEALGVVEDELVEEYLDGLGTPAERQAFERGFLASPRRTERLRFAAALRARAAKVVPERRSKPPLRGLGRMDVAHPALLGLAAALLLSVATNLWLASPWAPGQSRRDDGAAPVPAPVAPAARPSAPAPRVAASDGEDPAQAVARERHARRQAESRAAALESELRRARPGVVSFVLASGALRAAGALQEAVVPRDAALVELRLELPGVDYPQYRAELLDDTGEELLVASKLQAREERDAAILAVSVPAAALRRGDYQVRLRGLTAAGGEEAVGSYPFRVERR